MTVIFVMYLLTLMHNVLSYSLVLLSYHFYYRWFLRYAFGSI